MFYVTPSDGRITAEDLKHVTTDLRRITTQVQLEFLYNETRCHDAHLSQAALEVLHPFAPTPAADLVRSG